MKRRDSKNSLDIFKRLQVVRNTTEVEAATSSDDKAADSSASKPPTVVKKKLNIPIGDVLIDPDYEKNIPPTFVLPESFVRHTKRIGDEQDITIDYNMEDDDVVWMEANPRLANDKDAAKYLTVEAFEKIIDILERHTGFASDPVPQSHAEKIVVDRLHWPANVISKLVPEIYQCWLSKRERYQKPLCRRYWPQTSSNDTNPHHVFRPRDKDKGYRTRKQQRKNDIEAYRKMQQLKKEFTKAHELLQLVLERESLKESFFTPLNQLQPHMLYARIHALLEYPTLRPPRSPHHHDRS